MASTWKQYCGAFGSKPSSTCDVAPAATVTNGRAAEPVTSTTTNCALPSLGSVQNSSIRSPPSSSRLSTGVNRGSPPSGRLAVVVVTAVVVVVVATVDGGAAACSDRPGRFSATPTTTPANTALTPASFHDRRG